MRRLGMGSLHVPRYPLALGAASWRCERIQISVLFELIYLDSFGVPFRRMRIQISVLFELIYLDSFGVPFRRVVHFGSRVCRS